MKTGKYKYTIVWENHLRDEMKADSKKEMKSYVKWLYSRNQCPKPLNIFKSRPKYKPSCV